MDAEAESASSTISTLRKQSVFVWYDESMTDYSRRGHYYIKEPRFELRTLMPLLPHGGHVLDVGAGNGNNTRFLLENGYSVTAVDPNPRAIKDLLLLQKQYPKKLNVQKDSVDTYIPKEKYDVVVCCMVVHFMKNSADGIKAIHDIQSWTKLGGFNLVTSYMKDQPLSQDYSFLLGDMELSDLYRNWDVHWYEQSFRLAWSRIYSFMDIPRLALGKRGYKAARIIAQKI
jgi:SAM-dependent methyltransferase